LDFIVGPHVHTGPRTALRTLLVFLDPPARLSDPRALLHVGLVLVHGRSGLNPERVGFADVGLVCAAPEYAERTSVERTAEAELVAVLIEEWDDVVVAAAGGHYEDEDS